jgi:hypothetical protein
VAPYDLSIRSLSTSSGAQSSIGSGGTLHIGTAPVEITLSGPIQEFEKATSCQS